MRAAELLDIGPPFSSEGWFARVWQNARVLTTVCSGPFATVLPKVCGYVVMCPTHDRGTSTRLIQVRSILGPNVALRTAGYRSSEATIGLEHDANKVDEFVLKSDDVIEFLDVSQVESHEHLCQAVRICAFYFGN